MNRIKKSDIEGIKSSVDLLTLVKSRGIPLKKTGKNYFGKCPFHDDEKASFTVNPKENLFHCFGCSTGGDVIRFVELLDKCSFREAVATLSNKAVKHAVKEENNHSFSSRDLCPQSISPLNRNRLLSLAADFYHAAFNQRKDGKDYLAKRGITDSALFYRFKAGFCAGSIRESIPQDGNILEDLKTLGIITEKAQEFFKNCVVFPIPDHSGQIVNLYGRRIRNGQVNHLYLPGPKQGIFNGASIKTAEILILVESILDALALIQAGYTGAIPCYGSTGIPDQILEALKNHSGKPVSLCFDADDAGRSAAVKAKLQLEGIGITAKIKALPEGHDPCSILMEANGKAIIRDLFKQTGGNLPMASTKPPEIHKIISNNGTVRIQFPDRTYELKGIERAGARCKVTVKVLANGANGAFHLDTLDLYSHRSRSYFARSVSETFGVRDAQIASELMALVEPVENQKQTDQPEESAKAAMTDDEKQAALSLLTAADLFDRILQDFETVGITGEETNKLVGYLAAVSRKLKEPVSICIQSRSAAGKSALQDAILNFVPPEDVVRYTRLTGQALFYKEADSLKHKILAVEEDVGAQSANYSIRALQSSKSLSTAAAGRDPQTGRLRTDDHRVEGPTPVFMTTTSPELESETGSRFLVLTIDESVEATQRIHAAQRKKDTLEGLKMRKRTEKIIALHRNAQRLLQDDLQVLNPYSRDLEFHAHTLGTRRDHEKYLSLIKAITFLRQYQREIKETESDGETIRYVEVTLEDIRDANRLASEVLGTSLDELSPPSRRLLDLIRRMVMEKSQEHGIDPAEFTFSRRDIREYTGWSHAQVKRHISQLEEFEYIWAVMGHKGKEYAYELRYDQETDAGKRFLAGLIDVDKLEKKYNKNEGIG